MKRVLIALAVLFSLILCGICTWQWQREHMFRKAISELETDLRREFKERQEAEQKAEDYAKEIDRLTTLRKDIEAKLLDATEEIEQRIQDQAWRGLSIAVLMNEVVRASGGLEAYKELADKGADAVKQRNEEVTAQNAAIEKANAQLKQLVAERDDAVNKLNAKIREFNDLVEKYNKVSGGR